MRAGERAPALYRVAHAVLSPAVKAVWRPTVTGRPHVPDRGPAILAANHQSYLDSYFLPAVLDRAVFYLGKSDYFRGPRRYFYEGVGVMPVAREGGDAGERSLRRGQEVLERGGVLGIYPEGTRSPDGRLYRGKTGPVRLAMRTGSPILPVAIVGSFAILPTGARVPKRLPLAIHIGEPLPLERWSADRAGMRAATDELMSRIASMSGQDYVDEYSAAVKAGEAKPDEGSAGDGRPARDTG
ncbi:MAG: 1-acyl-sn-glycerol-3-phosphate acyltransferase [Actinomycetota bacterium]|nr:1-acyl-sn-glycerol-3-phosphate acyltransferase [Actinomycetota bacterium]